ncbi:hypothetical protein [Azospirillum sp. INR13]|uniref:hypothetical protein n=1 Tax=Azospirillum sp. INR13 TaxID=2596919 RepID=UPI002104527C|nr:hypothetical protein [Azospirillum sp. INR13]
MKFWKSLTLAAAAGAMFMSATNAQAAYPEKPITMIVAFGAGGGTDLLIRALAPFLEKQLGDGSRVEVVNKPGAGGEIGFAAIADSAPTATPSAPSTRPTSTPSRSNARPAIRWTGSTRSTIWSTIPAPSRSTTKGSSRR